MSTFSGKSSRELRLEELREMGCSEEMISFLKTMPSMKTWNLYVTLSITIVVNAIRSISLWC